MLSLAPAAEIASRGRSGSMGEPHWFKVAYGPAVAIMYRMPNPLGRAYCEYVQWYIIKFR